MKKFIISLLISAMLGSLYAQHSTLEYIEGEVVIKRISGDMEEAYIGDSISPGDSVITGADGYAELSLESSSTITIDRDTVFVFSHREKDEEKKSIFMIVLGKIGFKFDKLIQEPDIATPASIAGVRGTEFTVVSALDGSALYIVSEGSVAVEAKGGLVVLESQEGVAVPLGREPGEKFEVMIGQEDYSEWIDDGWKEFRDNPSDVLAGISSRLEEYALEAEDFYTRYDGSYRKLKSLRDKLDDIGNEQGTEARGNFYKKEVMPLEEVTGNFVLNYRYYALSALSLRRYVLTPMYVEMKTKYIMDQKNEIFTTFMKEYERFLSIFEEEVVPYLVEADI